jgi:tetratricopeptide (TPR) repeat protein
LAIQQKLADANPADTQFQSDLADSHNCIGVVLTRMGKLEEALEPYRKALDIREKLADANPATQFQSDLAESYTNIGDVLGRMGKWKEALAPLRTASAIYQKLADANPAVTASQRLLGASHMGIGNVLLETGKLEEALASFRKDLAIREKLVEANLANTAFQDMLAAKYTNIGYVLVRMGKSEEALKYLEETLQRMNAKHGPDHPLTLVALDGVAQGYLTVAALQAWLGQEQEWAATCERGLSLARDTKSVAVAERVARVCSLRPSNDKRHRAALLLAQRGMELGKGNRFFLPYFHMGLGMAEYRSGHFDKADAALLAAMESGKDNPHVAGTSAFYLALSLFRQGKLVVECPTVPEYRAVLGGIQSNLGRMFLEVSKEPETALMWCEKAVATQEEALRRGSTLGRGQSGLQEAHKVRADALSALHRHAAALKDYDKMVELARESERHFARSIRAAGLVRAGQVAAAIEEAEELAKNGDSLVLYQAACVYALASVPTKANPISPAQQVKYAERAIALLRQAVAKGFRDVNNMKNDDDLKSLRPRDDFQKLLRDMQK